MPTAWSHSVWRSGGVISQALPAVAQQVVQAGGQFVAAGVFGGEAGADAAAEGQQCFLSQHLAQPGIAGEDDAQQDCESKRALANRRNSERMAGFISCASSTNSTARRRVVSRWANQRFAQGFEAGPAVMGPQGTPKMSPNSR